MFPAQAGGCLIMGVLALAQSGGVIEVTQSLVELAGDYADTFALRGYDNLQLAAARMLQEGAGGAFWFACCDLRLQEAASVMGMQTLGRR